MRENIKQLGPRSDLKKKDDACIDFLFFANMIIQYNIRRDTREKSGKEKVK